MLVIPFWLMVLAAVVLWLAVAWIYLIKPRVMPVIDDYFAQRRHERRERNRLRRYVMKDVALTASIYKQKKVPAYATARHRR